MALASEKQGNDQEARIVFHTAYIECGGIRYLDSVVSFTKGSVEAKTKLRDGEGPVFYAHIDISDIEKIESRWSARCGAGMIRIYFISYSAHKDGTLIKDSGIKEFEFPVVYTNWLEKIEAVKALNARYKQLWNVELGTGVEESSPLPEGEDMLQRRSYFPEFDKPFGILTYPENGPDSVMIRKADVDRLLPDRFLNSPILDFYIRYLELKLTAEQKTKIHLFDPYFFQRLANIDGDPSSALDGKAAFERVRCYGNVNLLEKDFIFVPVCYSSHWSLIVICYFGEAAAAVCEDAAAEEVSRVPCILHMNSVRGTHGELKHLMQSYLLEELKERTKETCQNMKSNFRKLKFVSLKLPQQQNGSDCGLFVLHYLERFLEEVPLYFNINKLPSFSKFLQPDWFPPNEASSLKRAHIARLIKGLLDNRPNDSYERDINIDAHDSDSVVKVVQVITVSDYENSESGNDARLPSLSKRKTSRSKIFEGELVSLTQKKKRKSSSVPLRTNDEFSSEQIETTPPPSVSERRDDLEKESSGAATRGSKEHQMSSTDDHSTQPSRRSSRVPKRNPKYFDDTYIL